MSDKITCKWTKDMQFQTTINGHNIIMDADESVGGQDAGPRPKPLMLAALSGCTGMDVVSILRKMRIEFDDVLIDVEYEMTDEHPRIYNKIHLIYHVFGNDINVQKVERAVQLSQENYCGVSAMLKKASDLSYEIKINQ